MKAESKLLILRDGIHGDMSFNAFLRQVIDHSAFQRLRQIKQLGLAEYVFPCATHTRFQHSLGASYLAGQYFQALVQVWMQSPFQFEGHCEKTTFFSQKTESCLKTVVGEKHSLEFWHETASLGGLLHDTIPSSPLEVIVFGDNDNSTLLTLENRVRAGLMMFKELHLF